MFYKYLYLSPSSYIYMSLLFYLDLSRSIALSNYLPLIWLPPLILFYLIRFTLLIDWSIISFACCLSHSLSCFLNLCPLTYAHELECFLLPSHCIVNEDNCCIALLYSDLLLNEGYDDVTIMNNSTIVMYVFVLILVSYLCLFLY